MTGSQRPNTAQPAARPTAASAPEPKPGLFGTFVLGVRVWAREMRRLMGGQARLHEVRQLEARLREETSLLARLEGAPGPERNLCLKQIEMLKAEIARLRAETGPGPACKRPPCDSSNSVQPKL